MSSVWFFSPVSSSIRSSSSSALLARLVEQAHLEILGQLDREHAELALVVELDGRMTGRARRLLVRGEQRILERGHEGARLDPLLALDLANGLDNLLGHRFCIAQPSSIRFARTMLVVGDLERLALRRPDGNGALARRDDLAAKAPIAGPAAAPGGRPRARSERACAAAGRSPGEETSTE